MLLIISHHRDIYQKLTGRKKVQLEDVPETQDTFLKSHEQGRQESRQSVSLLPVFRKIYSEMVAYRLGGGLIHHKKLTLFHTGFTKGR
jgi:hypothetical protein